MVLHDQNHTNHMASTPGRHPSRLLFASTVRQPRSARSTMSDKNKFQGTVYTRQTTRGASSARLETHPRRAPAESFSRRRETPRTHARLMVVLEKHQDKKNMKKETVTPPPPPRPAQEVVNSVKQSTQTLLSRRGHEQPTHGRHTRCKRVEHD